MSYTVIFDRRHSNTNQYFNRVGRGNNGRKLTLNSAD